MPRATFPVVIAIHGGAGTLTRATLTRKGESLYLAALEAALEKGRDALLERGGALEAVTAAVVALEDDPLFNAGHGAVYNADGEHELDAAIMDGATRRAGAVCVARRTRNPVLVARAVMERTAHVMLAAGGADRFAREQGLAMVAPAYFGTARRRAALEAERARQRGAVARRATEAERHGTVGAVALDARGNLAAATSTGGYTNKPPGRVGDSPVIGAGTYADNRACAVSATGTGEYFMRALLAYDVVARMHYLRAPLARAAAQALARVTALGGSGGLIALDRAGRLAMPFTTEGMYRAYARGRSRPVVAIFR
jgi:isoaspartyl peptidase/L-asparaginase-like protein (Ntn-hydrolase superfamily)